MRWLLVLAMIGCSANDDIPAPQISSLNPNHGPAGGVIMIAGQYFCQQPQGEDPVACDSATGTVSFDASPGIVSDYTDTSIMVEVPTGLSGHVTVRVTAAGKTSNAAGFTAE